MSPSSQITSGMAFLREAEAAASESLPTTGFLLSFSRLVSSGSWDSWLYSATPVLPSAPASSQTGSVHPRHAWKSKRRLFVACLRVFKCMFRRRCQLGCFLSAIHKTPLYTLSAARSPEPGHAHSEPSANPRGLLYPAGCLLLLLLNA